MAAIGAASSAMSASLTRPNLSLAPTKCCNGASFLRTQSHKTKCIFSSETLNQCQAAAIRRGRHHRQLAYNQMSLFSDPLVAPLVEPRLKADWEPVTEAAWKQASGSDLPEVLWTKVPIKESERVAKQLFHIQVDISEIPELRNGFTTPGQFVQVKIGTGKPTFLSIASTPKSAEMGIMEFLIKDVEGTTAAEVCALPVGTEVDISQVMGKGFSLDKLSPPEACSTVLIFAAGSAISPIRSVIETEFGAKERTDVRLYYGAENLPAMAYKERFRAWEVSGVKVIPVLSEAHEDWAGEKGFIQAAYSRGSKPADPSQTGVLLCGHKEMAEEARSILEADGIPADKILLNF